MKKIGMDTSRCPGSIGTTAKRLRPAAPSATPCHCNRISQRRICWPETSSSSWASPNARASNTKNTYTCLPKAITLPRRATWSRSCATSSQLPQSSCFSFRKRRSFNAKSAMSDYVRFLRFALATCACVVMLFGIARANTTTLSDYQHRVSAAANLMEELHGAGEDESRTESSAFISTNLQKIRELLPANETVLVNGQTIAVDNSWLHKALADYEKANSGTARAEMLARIAERLRAIEDRLKEIQNGNAANSSDKDANKGKLAEILRRPEYIQKAPEGSALECLLERFLRWLSRLFPQNGANKPGGCFSIFFLAGAIFDCRFLLGRVSLPDRNVCPAFVGRPP